MLAHRTPLRIAWLIAALLLAPATGQAQRCQLVPEHGIVVAENGRNPQIVAGDREILVAHEVRTQDADLSNSPTVLAIDLPLGSAAVRTVREGQTFDPGQAIIPRATLTRAGSAPAAFFWTIDLVAGGGCPCWDAELVVPSAPGRNARVHHVNAIMDTMVLPVGGSVLAITVDLDGAIDAFSFGRRTVGHRRIVARDAIDEWDDLRVWERGDARISLAAYRPSSASTVFTVDSRARRVGPLRRLVLESGWPIELLEVREEGRHPEIVVRGPSAGARSLEGLSRAPRFAPSRLEIGGHPWLVYAEGMRSSTRIYAAPLDAASRVSGPPVRLRDRETGRVAADAYAGHAYVAWIERAARSWETRVAELRCDAS